MQIVYDILKEFQKEFSNYVEGLKNSNHHYDKDNLNIYHLCGDSFTHTMMVFNSFVQKLQNDKIFIINKKMKEMISVMLLCHDIGKIYTRKEIEDKKRVSFYGHGYASVQPCIEFIYHLQKKGIINFNNEEIYNILCVISNHIEYYASDDKKRIKMYNNNYMLFSLFEFMLEFDKAGSITDVGEYRSSTFEINPEEKYLKKSPCITLYCGSPASGKDYLAGKYSNGIILSYDDIRIETYLRSGQVRKTLSEAEIYKDAFHYCIDNKVNVEQILINKTRKLLKEGKDVIICNIGIRKKARKRIISQFPKVLVNIVYVISDIETMYSRDLKRKSKNLGYKILDKFIYDQQIPLFSEGINNIDLLVN